MRERAQVNFKKLIKNMLHLFAALLLTCSVHAQDYENPETVVAESQGYQLKMKHVLAYMGMKMAMNQMPQNPTDAQTEAVASEALMVFNTSPAATIQQLDAFAAELGLGGSTVGTTSRPNLGSPNTPAPSSNLEGGFNMEAELAKFGPNQLDFHSNTAAQLKQLLSGTLLVDSSSSFSDSPNGSHYISSSANIHFCPNGSFTWASEAFVGIDTPGMTGRSGGGPDNDAVTGYWDVATGGGQTFIMLYSRHPEMLQLNPNGFIPMPVNAFQADLVAIPNANAKTGEDLYRVNRGQAQCR